jgi:hypothetical protein
MSLPPYLAFIQDGLSVGYVAAPEPQEMRVELVLAEPHPVAVPPARLHMLVDAINAGAAGGADFAPGAGKAKILSGPAPSLDPATQDHGPAYRWALEVAGVSPLFLPLAVHVLALAGEPVPITRLTLAGARRADYEHPSVGDAQVGAWLRELGAFPGRWPTLPFELREDLIARGCAIRVRFDGDATPEVTDRLDEVIGLWGLVVVGCPSLARDGIGKRSLLDRLGVGRSEYSRYIEEFDYAQEIAGSVLVNMLARFHEDVLPIACVDLRMP